MYILTDFKVRLREPFVFSSEILISLLMLLDVILYNLVTNFKVSLLVIIEWITVTAYITMIFTMIIFYNKNKNEE